MPKNGDPVTSRLEIPEECLENAFKEGVLAHRREAAMPEDSFAGAAAEARRSESWERRDCISMVRRFHSERETCGRVCWEMAFFSDMRSLKAQIRDPCR